MYANTFSYFSVVICGFDISGHTKICNFDKVVFTDQNISCSQVSVQAFLLIQEFHSFGYLPPCRDKIQHNKFSAMDKISFNSTPLSKFFSFIFSTAEKFDQKFCHLPMLYASSKVTRQQQDFSGIRQVSGSR